MLEFRNGKRPRASCARGLTQAAGVPTRAPILVMKVRCYRRLHFNMRGTQTPECTRSRHIANEKRKIFTYLYYSESLCELTVSMKCCRVANGASEVGCEGGKVEEEGKIFGKRGAEGFRIGEPRPEKATEDQK